MLEKTRKIECSVVDEVYVKKVLRVIAAEFDPTQHEIYTTSNIRESRLISASDVYEKRQVSCGSHATLIASILRNLGVSTKIIHGRFIETNPEMRHAWNEVLLDDNQWVPFDISGKKRGISKYHVREFEVADWEEVEDRIERI